MVSTLLLPVHNEGRLKFCQTKVKDRCLTTALCSGLTDYVTVRHLVPLKVTPVWLESLIRLHLIRKDKHTHTPLHVLWPSATWYTPYCMPDQTMAADELKNDKSRQMFSPRTRPLKPSLTIHDWYTNITPEYNKYSSRYQYRYWCNICRTFVPFFANTLNSKYLWK